jgi:hypothetical protein
MNLSNLHKKAQALPLNTIVIAILVVIVLLIIIVTFTDSFTGTSGTINEAAGCSETNPLVNIKYENPEWVNTGSEDSNQVKVTGVPSRTFNDVAQSCYATLKASN